MPQGTPYNAFIPPYPIRVDDFTDPSSSTHTFSGRQKTASLYLLTHTHTDHLMGLSARSFGQTVVCSHDTKEMLLRHEVYAERALRDAELRAENVRTFAHLKVEPQRMEDGSMDYTGSRDLLVRHPRIKRNIFAYSGCAYSELHIRTSRHGSFSTMKRKSKSLSLMLTTVQAPLCKYSLGYRRFPSFKLRGELGSSWRARRVRCSIRATSGPKRGSSSLSSAIPSSNVIFANHDLCLLSTCCRRSMPSILILLVCSTTTRSHPR